jgi:AcrR family transcriptional regulator
MELTQTLGLRERNKLDKLKRIKEAARTLFLQRGYDNTTTREIARVADVGLGTLFSYASDKRDLLFLIINDDLETMTAADEQTPLTQATIEQQIHAFSRCRFEFFGRQPALSRLILREQQFYADSIEASRFQATRQRAHLRLAQLVAQAQQNGTVDASVDAELAARLIFVVYQMEIRAWLAREPLDLEAGMASLDRSMALLLRGMRPGA